MLPGRVHGPFSPSTGKGASVLKWSSCLAGVVLLSTHFLKEGCRSQISPQLSGTDAPSSSLKDGFLAMTEVMEYVLPKRSRKQKVCPSFLASGLFRSTANNAAMHVGSQSARCPVSSASSARFNIRAESDISSSISGSSSVWSHSFNGKLLYMSRAKSAAVRETSAIAYSSCQKSETTRVSQ